MKKLATAAIALALLTSACGGSGSDESERGEGSVRIGVVGPQTGSAPQYYTDLVRPLELASAELGEKYGLDVEIVTADDQGTPEGASSAVQKLLNEENVDAIFGPPQSGNALQVSEVIQRTGRPWLVPAISPEIMNEDLDPNWLFRTNFDSADLSNVVAQLLFAGDSTVGVVHATDATGQSSLTSLEAAAKDLGKQITGVEAIQPGASDFSAGIARLKDKGVDSVFIAVTAGADTSTITKAIVQEGLNPKLVVTNATILADFATLADPAQWKNLVFVDPRDLTGENMATLTSDYEAKYGEAPILPTNVYSVEASLDAYLGAVSAAGDAQDYAAVLKSLEDIPTVSVGTDQFEKPFGPGDHELYEADEPDQWIVFGFDDAGQLQSRGDLAACIASGC